MGNKIEKGDLMQKIKLSFCVVSVYEVLGKRNIETDEEAMKVINSVFDRKVVEKIQDFQMSFDEEFDSYKVVLANQDLAKEISEDPIVFANQKRVFSWSKS